jgi:nitrogen fixation NifU-like protein
MMTAALKGRSDAEAKELFEKFHAMVTTPTDQEPETESMGKLAVFAGVREYPARVKCASLAWHTLMAAMKGSSGSISTE